MSQITEMEVNQPSRGEISGVRLLEIAADLFRENGYAGTSVRLIADRAGMKAGSIYYHFASKDELLDQVLERGISAAIENFREAVEALPKGATIIDRFIASVTAHIRTVHECGNFTTASRQLLNKIPKELYDKHVAKRKMYDDLWSNLIEEGCREGIFANLGNNKLNRQFLLGSLSWTSEWVDPEKKSYEELGKIASKLFLHGLVGHAESV